MGLPLGFDYSRQIPVTAFGLGFDYSRQIPVTAFGLLSSEHASVLNRRWWRHGRNVLLPGGIGL